MDKENREKIGNKIRHELQKGTHTFTMCKCGRNGCRSGKCWACWLDVLVNGNVQDVLYWGAANNGK